MHLLPWDVVLPDPLGRQSSEYIHVGVQSPLNVHTLTFFSVSVYLYL